MVFFFQKEKKINENVDRVVIWTFTHRRLLKQTRHQASFYLSNQLYSYISWFLSLSSILPITSNPSRHMVFDPSATPSPARSLEAKEASSHLPEEGWGWRREHTVRSPLLLSNMKILPKNKKKKETMTWWRLPSVKWLTGLLILATLLNIGAPSPRSPEGEVGGEATLTFSLPLFFFLGIKSKIIFC